MKYFIDYGTGAGNEWVDGTLEEAKTTAVIGISYTQTDIVIYDEERNEVTRLLWWAVEPCEDDYITARFGNFGFYGKWNDT